MQSGIIPPKNELLGIQHCLGFNLAILPRCKYCLFTGQAEKLRWEKCQSKHFDLINTCLLVIGQKNELSLEKLLYTIHYLNLSRIYFC